MKKAFAILLVITFLACQKELDSLNNNTGPYNCKIFPLSIANKWLYKATVYNSNGLMDSVKTDTVKVIDTITFNGNTYYKYSNLFLRNKDCNTIGLWNDNSKSEIDIKNNSPSNNYEIFNLAPAGQGLTCTGGTKILINKDRTIINSHDCFKVQFLYTSCSNKPTGISNFYISEGIGIVKSEKYAIKSGEQILSYIQELDSYFLNP